MKTYRLNGVIADFEDHSDFFDVCSPKGLKKFLDSLEDGERAEIEINSPGGYVVYGVEMANAIKNSKAHIVAHVVGMAASMASVIACACDEIVMEEASFMMIHDPWGYTEGNAEEMRKEAKLLDQMKEVCMGFYLGKPGLPATSASRTASPARSSSRISRPPRASPNSTSSRSRKRRSRFSRSRRSPTNRRQNSTRPRPNRRPCPRLRSRKHRLCLP